MLKVEGQLRFGFGMLFLVRDSLFISIFNIHFLSSRASCSKFEIPRQKSWRHIYNSLRIAFYKWGEMFGKMARSGSLKNAINYLVKPAGWSHDGSTKTTKQLRDEA